MSDVHPFEDPERLRLLLVDVHYGGDRPWESDPDVAELLALTNQKYAALAAKHHRDPSEATAAAWDVMRTRAARIADDPWAVITHAVALQMFYEERAQGLLCGADQVRTDDVDDFHDANRISDHEANLADFHPSFWSFDDVSEIDEPLLVRPGDDPDDESTNAWVAVETAVEFFVDLGWPRATARMALDCISARLIRTGNKQSTFESLRRDPTVRCHLDIDQESWIDVLHAVLGHDHPNFEHTAAGRGILKRLLTGERYDELFNLPGLADTIANAAPTRTERTSA